MKEIIKAYYQEFEGEEITPEISYQSARLGYGMGEYDGCLVTFSITGTMELLGKKQPYEETLSEEELKKIFTKVLRKAEFLVTNFSISSGVHSISSGYGMMETAENQAYFDGISVEGHRQKGKAKELMLKKEGRENE